MEGKILEPEEIDGPLNSIDVNMIESNFLYDTEKCCRKAKSKFSLSIKETSRKALQHHSQKVQEGNNVQKNNENGCEERSNKGSLSETSVERIISDSVNPCNIFCKVEMNESGNEPEKGVDLNFKGVECQLCNQTYSNELNLKKHIYNVHKMVKVKCEICGKEINKKSLDRHMRCVHSASISVKKERKPVPDDEKIPCHLCNKKCLNLISLQCHMKNIHQAERLKCSQCDFQGIRKELKVHVKKQHTNEVYQCSRCQKILKSKSTLKEHMWIHTDHRRFICDICGMRFKRTSNYHGHLKSHQKKKFQCQLCGNFFLRKRYLAVHEQTIHNYYGEGVPPLEKGYQCEVCGIKLKWKNNLLAHMRIHTGEKPYKCRICGDDFTCHGSLRTHLAKHI